MHHLMDRIRVHISPSTEKVSLNINGVMSTGTPCPEKIVNELELIVFDFVQAGANSPDRILDQITLAHRLRQNLLRAFPKIPHHPALNQLDAYLCTVVNCRTTATATLPPSTAADPTLLNLWPCRVYSTFPSWVRFDARVSNKRHPEPSNRRLAAHWVSFCRPPRLPRPTAGPGLLQDRSSTASPLMGNDINRIPHCSATCTARTRPNIIVSGTESESEATESESA